MTPHAIVLYIILPFCAAGISAYRWGGAILDSSKVKTYGEALLRGLGVSAATYLIFAMLYACVLPILEGGWSLGRVTNLFLMTLTLGILMGGPVAAATGIIGGTTLFGFGRQVFGESDSRRETGKTSLFD